MDIIDVIFMKQLADKIQREREQKGLPRITIESVEQENKDKTLPAHIESHEHVFQCLMAILIFWKDKLPREAYMEFVEIVMAINIHVMMEEAEKTLKEQQASNATDSNQPNEHQSNPGNDEAGVPAAESNGEGGGPDDLGVRVQNNDGGHSG